MGVSTGNFGISLRWFAFFFNPQGSRMGVVAPLRL